jgi:murein tripeptide amidase MpaA
MRGATSLEYISGELEAQENRLSSTMARSTPANGSLHRKSYTDNLEVFELTNISTVEYVTQQLIQGYKDGDNVTQSFLDNYDFYIFPFVNPDGMHYHPLHLGFDPLTILRFCLHPDQRALVAEEQTTPTKDCRQPDLLRT